VTVAPKAAFAGGLVAGLRSEHSRSPTADLVYPPARSRP
jgi:hypothetical protein